MILGLGMLEVVIGTLLESNGATAVLDADFWPGLGLRAATATRLLDGDGAKGAGGGLPRARRSPLLPRIAARLLTLEETAGGGGGCAFV